MVSVPGPMQQIQLHLQTLRTGFSSKESVQKPALDNQKIQNGGVTPYVTPPPKKNTKIQNTKKIEKCKNTKKDPKIKYRGKGKLNRRDSTFSVMLSNLRGYKSKECSLKKILKKVKPSVILLVETQLVGNMKVSLNPGYTSWTRNRTERGGGGIATAVSQQYSDTAP